VVNTKTIVAIVAAALIAGLAYRLWWPNDERAIRNQLALIEQVGTKAEAEPPMEGLVKATRLAALFSDPCRLTVESVQHDGAYPRKQIQERILMARSSFPTLAVSLHDVAIERLDARAAAVRATLRLRGKGTGEPLAAAQELTAELAKVDGQWLFTAVTLVEVVGQ